MYKLRNNKVATVTTSLCVLLLLWGTGCASKQQSVAPIVRTSIFPADRVINVDGRWIDTHSNTPLAMLNQQGEHLVYGVYANNRQGNYDHILPDFSYAGYKKGGVALPSYASLPVKEILSPLQGDNSEQIQAAIDRVAALPINNHGIRGVVLLRAGEYQVKKQITVSTSGVVIRGEGQGDNGTILKATSTKHRDRFIYFQGVGGNRMPNAAEKKAKTDILQSIVPVGSKRIDVASVTGYQVGDEIAIVRTPNNKWVSEEGIDTAQYGWKAAKYKMFYERVITAIEGNTLVFDIPVVDTIEQQFGGGYVYRIDVSGRIQQVGLENVQLQTQVFRFDVADENRAFYAVDLRNVQHAWVRDVTVKYFSHAYNLRYGVRFNTLQNVAFVEPNFEVTGGRHYGFNFDGGSFNLFQRCYAKKVRHSFVSGSKVTGPNVYLDCLAVDSDNDSGPHHRWGTGTLFDNTKGVLLRVQNRQTSGSGHGWAGAQQLFWNNEYDEYVLQAPPYAMNWSVGFIGEQIDGHWSPNEATGIVESPGKHVAVRSIYLQQLQDRLGKAAVEAVTISAQRQGTIWALLSAWQGKTKLPNE